MKIPFKNPPKIAQSTIEFSVVIIVICAAILLMGPYVIRGINAHMKGWEDAVYDSMSDPLMPVADVPNIPTSGCSYNCGDKICCAGVENKDNCIKDCNTCGDGYPCSESDCVDPDTPERCCEDGWDSCQTGAAATEVFCCAQEGYFRQSTITDDKTVKGDECASDCVPITNHCGNNTCEADKGENKNNCCRDCAPNTPNDGVCCALSRGGSESIGNSQADCCVGYCGNGHCDSECNEDENTCPADCVFDCSKVDCQNYDKYFENPDYEGSTCHCCGLHVKYKHCCNFLSCGNYTNWQCVPNCTAYLNDEEKCKQKFNCKWTGRCEEKHDSELPSGCHYVMCLANECALSREVQNPNDGECGYGELITYSPTDCCPVYCGNFNQCLSNPDCWTYCSSYCADSCRSLDFCDAHSQCWDRAPSQCCSFCPEYPNCEGSCFQNCGARCDPCEYCKCDKSCPGDSPSDTRPKCGKCTPF